MDQTAHLASVWMGLAKCPAATMVSPMEQNQILIVEGRDAQAVRQTPSVMQTLIAKVVFVRRVFVKHPDVMMAF